MTFTQFSRSMTFVLKTLNHHLLAHVAFLEPLDRLCITWVILDSPVRSTLFYSGQAEFQSSIREQLCRSCSEYTTVRGGVVGVERSRDQTKMAEMLNGIKTSTNISSKTRNSY